MSNYLKSWIFSFLIAKSLVVSTIATAKIPSPKTKNQYLSPNWVSPKTFEIGGKYIAAKIRVKPYKIPQKIRVFLKKFSVLKINFFKFLKEKI